MNSGDHDYLLGLFAVDGTHNLVHMLTGIVGLAAGLSRRLDYARAYFLVFGVVYGLVTIIGFIQGATVLGIIPVNGWDNFLHLAIAVVSFAVYFLSASSAGDRFRAGEQSRLAR